MYQFLDGKKVTVVVRCTYLFGRGHLFFSGTAFVDGNIIHITKEYNGFKSECEIDTDNVKDFDFRKIKTPETNFALEVELNV